MLTSGKDFSWAWKRLGEKRRYKQSEGELAEGS